jgi:2-polyprenyl-3-methyl-5-hydroxy-6-metoxy-1,4-benzoquinol methylase
MTEGAVNEQAAEIIAGAGPATAKVVLAVLERWPDHAKFLGKSFAGRSQALLQTTEEIASLLLRVAEHRKRPLSAFVDDYRYLCEEIVFPEEMFFRREGRYRLSTFAEANAEVYANGPLMEKYMNGLFLSDALWVNHASAMNDFATEYLPHARAGGHHLEIGPGHGLLLHLAIRAGRFSSLSAWDVSATSISHAREVLQCLGESQRVALELQDMYAPEALERNRGRFDTVVLSEVLEHLERPLEALVIIRELLAPGGSVWINVPANGPAPDHLFLLRSVDEAAELAAQAGLRVDRTDAFPVAGANLDRAVRQQLPVSCVVVGTKAA